VITPEDEPPHDTPTTSMDDTAVDLLGDLSVMLPRERRRDRRTSDLAAPYRTPAPSRSRTAPAIVSALGRKPSSSAGL